MRPGLCLFAFPLIVFAGVAACSSGQDVPPSVEGTPTDPADEGAVENGEPPEARDEPSPAGDPGSDDKDAGRGKDATSDGPTNDANVPDVAPAPPQPPPPSKVCVEGDQFNCKNAGGTWDGAKCCLSQPVSCASTSTQQECRSFSNEFWTGAKCCTYSKVTCSPEPTPPNATYCTLAYTHYWDETCCVNGTRTCVDGIFSYCNGAGGVFTGTKCCLPGVQTCEPMVSGTCPLGTKGTGKLCCTPQ